MLDSLQIENYGLATQLRPQKFWWEGIELPHRNLHFFVLRDWLCGCVLICEDLARQDPAGHIVRAVGPDLVIALLFDGPQIPTRWPAYHATVLADDPGSSVLTLSCLGMTNLSRPRSVDDPDRFNRVIGMLARSSQRPCQHQITAEQRSCSFVYKQGGNEKRDCRWS